MPPAESPSRRVLGTKTTNATIHRQSPLKSTKNVNSDLQGLKAYKSIHQQTRTKAGTKRSIDEVEDAERIDPQENNSQQSTGTQALSLGDTSFESEDESTSANEYSRTTNDTEAMSFGPSQPDAPMESTFELIEDEPSQNTRDSWNAVPLPQNASQPQGLRPTLAQNLSQVSAGMSSFVDFDIVTGEELKPIEPAFKAKMAGREYEVATSTNDDDRRKRVDAHAEQLRTRLQLAMFKVNTNQTTTPFSRLRVQTKAKSPEPQPLSSSPPSSPVAPQRISQEARMAIARAKATMQAKKPVRSLESLPVPTITPTEYSARTVQPSSLNQQLPSSPPKSRHASTDGADETPRPLVRPFDQSKTPKTPMQLSSPPGSPEHSKRKNTIQRVAQQARNERLQNLTSSTVKGDAANVLLLMKGSDD